MPAVPRTGFGRQRLTAALLVGTALGIAMPTAAHAAPPQRVSGPARSAWADDDTAGPTPAPRRGVHASMGCFHPETPPAAGNGSTDPAGCALAVVICDGDRRMAVFMGPGRQPGRLPPDGASSYAGLSADIGGPCEPEEQPTTPPHPQPPTSPAPTPPVRPTPGRPVPPSGHHRPTPPSPAMPIAVIHRPAGPPKSAGAAPHITGPVRTPDRSSALPQAPYPRPSDSQRWLLLTMMAVLLPAVLAAAVPLVGQRRR